MKNSDYEEIYHFENLHVNPERFAWHDPHFRSKAKVGDVVSFLDGWQDVIGAISKTGLWLGSANNGAPRTFYSWQELIWKEVVIVEPRS